MNYEEAVDYINQIPRFTTKNKPEHTRELMRRLGNPERSMKVIHVAGTNGKGSVCAFLSSILVCAGKHTALFTSPHLVCINERFQIDHRPASDEEFLAAFEAVYEAVRKMEQDGMAHPTYFEFLYAMGMTFFERQRAEYCVLETGLGGRLDATNTVDQPIASVITSISFDHMEYLGNTISEIAAEKAGILKAGVPVIFDAGNPEAAEVICSRAEQLECSAEGLSRAMIEIFHKSDKSIDFSLHFGYYENKTVTVSYPAEYQAVNSSLALMTMEIIDPAHEIPLEVRLEGIAKAKWPGRMETVLPGVILDGAHNEDGIRQFVNTARELGSGRRLVLLFSAVADKKFEGMIQSICTQLPLSAVVVTEIPGTRKEPAAELGSLFERYSSAQVRVIDDIEKAFDEALRLREDGLLFCVGSLYLIGALKELLTRRKKE